MAQIKAKITLKNSGEEAYVSVKQLRATLKWTAAVDLDLMVFYKAKDGKVGGVFSDNYAGGTMGNLNTFPFIMLSQDAGVGAKGGENEEDVRITKLDDMAELYICTLNFTDASQNRAASFSRYDAHIVVADDRGESVGVPLDSTQNGTVAVIAKIDNTSPMGAKLINLNKVMDFNAFQSSIPGANLLQISSKIVLKNKGETAKLKIKNPGSVGEILVNLNWNQKGTTQKKGFLGNLLGAGGGSGIDLDLGCLFDVKAGTGKGAIQALGESWGKFDGPPYILHCGDDRTGAASEGENLRINGTHLGEFNRILVYAFIYEGVSNWSQTDAVVTIRQPGSPDIVIELDEHKDGVAMCALALFENTGPTLSVKKIIQYFRGHEDMDRAFNWGLRWTAGTK